MDKGDWIYIVFLALSILGGLFGKKKKKNGKPAGRGQNPPKKIFDLNELFEKLGGELNPKPRAEPKPYREPLDFVEEEVVSFEEEKVHKEFEPVKTRYVNYDTDVEEGGMKKVGFQVHSEKEHSEQFNYEQETSEHSEYDLREMVIHSTILNRPEF